MSSKALGLVINLYLGVLECGAQVYNSAEILVMCDNCLRCSVN